LNKDLDIIHSRLYGMKEIDYDKNKIDFLVIYSTYLIFILVCYDRESFGIWLICLHIVWEITSIRKDP
jgi:hypothetical protein